MKRTLIVILLTFLAFFLLSTTNRVNASNNPIAYQSGIGYSINTATADFADSSDIKIGSPILSTSYLQSVTLNRVQINETNSVTKSDSSFSDLTTQLNVAYGVSSAASYTDGMFSGGVSSAFQQALSYDYSNYYSSYYYVKNVNIDRYSLSLPNYSSNIEEYQNNANSTFLNYVNIVRLGHMSVEALFDMYGTHMIANGIYGGRLELYYSLTSNQVEFTSSTETHLESKMDVASVGLGSATSNVSVDVYGQYGLTESNTNLGFYLMAKGGNAFDIVDMDDFASNYYSWLSSINDEDAVLCNFGYDGLIPIWDIIPDTPIYSSVKNNLESYYPVYLEEKANDVAEDYSYAGDLGDSYYNTGYELVRNQYWNIDDNPANNNSDYVDFGELFDIDLELMDSLGYVNVDIKVKFDVAEINDGYQQFRISRSDQDISSDLIEEWEFEHTPGSINTTFSTHYFYENNVNINQFLDNYIYFFWDARGLGKDNWYCKNVYIKLVITKY
ncbi:MAG: MAC/perforin domain-containing protein [Candidatus Izemoplasmatales bacterium]|nr:MAC/perforin domain-containing protein [Candidatus Izemoplasmatales bacterium]